MVGVIGGTSIVTRYRIGRYCLVFIMLARAYIGGEQCDCPGFNLFSSYFLIAKDPIF